MKRIISALLCLMMLLTSAVGVTAGTKLTSGAPETVPVIGDVNGDGRLNAIDALTLKLSLADIISTVPCPDMTDIDGDTYTNMSDVLAMKRLLAGLDITAGTYDRCVQRMRISGMAISEFTVVIPEETTLSVQYAADELVYFTKEACGVTMSIATSEGEAHHSIFLIPDTQYNSQGDGVIDLGTDGLAIKVADGNLYIYGSDGRGVLYGVYEFLERYMGWRFINDEVNYCFEANMIDVTDGTEYYHIPVIRDRDSHSYMYGDFTAAAVRRRINSGKSRGALERQKKYGFCVGYIGTAHSVAEWLPEITNADYICWSSTDETNPDSNYSRILAAVLAKIQKNIGKGDITEQVSISPMDNPKYCSCRECRLLSKSEGTAIAPQIKFLNKISGAINEVYPGTKVWSLIYVVDKHAPKTLTVSDNVTLCFCWNGCNNHGFDSGECKGVNTLGVSNTIEKECFESWTKVANNLYVWYYATSYSYMLGEPSLIYNVWGDLKYLASSGITGFYAEGFYGNPENGDGNCFDKLLMYLLAKCAWDPYMSYDEFLKNIDEFLYIYYGEESWEYVKEYMVMWDEASNRKGCWINNYDWTFDAIDRTYYAEHFDEMVTILDNAYTAATDDVYRERIERISASAYWLGLSSTYIPNYRDGSAEQRAVYEARYTKLWNWIQTYNIVDVDSVKPEGELDFSVSPYAWTHLTKFSRESDELAY